MFISDRVGKLSEDGLERGSVALVVYYAFIQSEWMQKYSNEELVLFGRRLQIIDDALDLEEDVRAGDKNCLFGVHAGMYRDELRKFLESGFFTELTDHSQIYARISRALRRHLGERVPLNTRELLDTTRPITVVFAFVLTCLGFKVAGSSLLPAVLYGAAFAGVTASIMVFNDLSDWKRDLLKGKRLVRDYAKQMRLFHRGIAATTGVLVVIGTALDWKGGAIVALTWALGLLYSAIKLPYPWNNLLVAACAAAPVLVGMAYSGRFEAASCFFFIVVFGAIAVREVFKDIEDSAADVGHKDTLPVRVGTNRAALHGARLMYPVLAVAAFYPHTLVQLVPALFAPSAAALYVGILYCRQTCRLKQTETYEWAQRAIDVFLAGYIVVFWLI